MLFGGSRDRSDVDNYTGLGLVTNEVRQQSVQEMASSSSSGATYFDAQGNPRPGLQFGVSPVGGAGPGGFAILQNSGQIQVVIFRPIDHSLMMI